MKISYIHIQNFKSIRELIIKEVDNALILVGKNNTGKTVVIDAIRLAAGQIKIKETDFLQIDKNIVIGLKVEFNDEDLEIFHSSGIVSKYKKYELWEKDFMSKLPSYKNGVLSFECIINKTGTVKYSDGIKKHNPYIKGVFPKTFYINHTRNVEDIENEVFRFYDNQAFNDLREDICMFDRARKCNRCFNCIGVINKKIPEELTVFETARLMEYKMIHTNLNRLSDKVNKYFYRNGSNSQEIKYAVNFNVDEVFQIDTHVYNRERETIGEIQTLSEGLRSLYALSLLETYIEEESTIPCIITIEDPEIFLHPQLQKNAGDILLRLSRKNQVIFSTHSPNMIFNFASKQIKQILLNEEGYTVTSENTDIDEILDDLGYTANDLMNVSFVFIVEGKQDSNRLPLLLEKYYSEIHDDEGKLQRISIIPTNSCTNIKTYANLKYMNKVYLKDQFLMIRDSDGKNPKSLVKQLCSYYSQRAEEDVGNLPRVTPKNVLILKYYSFENYFLDPRVMAQIGVVKSEDEFYTILYNKYKEYLYKLSSTKKMVKAEGVRIRCKEDIKKNMELIKIYIRGHNLFDIFYGKYRKNEAEILKNYIDLAPEETFEDILAVIDSFLYFNNRKK